MTFNKSNGSHLQKGSVEEVRDLNLRIAENAKQPVSAKIKDLNQRIAENAKQSVSAREKIASAREMIAKHKDKSLHHYNNS